MYFDNIQELWSMAGHGPYVWAAYGITCVTLLGLLWLPLRGKQQQTRNLRAFYRRQSHGQEPLADLED